MRLLNGRRGGLGRMKTGVDRVEAPSAIPPSEEAVVAPAATESGVADHTAVALPWDGPRISTIRAGYYVIDESDSPRAGTIHGDYVVGFIVRYGSATGRFSSMAQVHEFVAAQYQGRQGAVIAS
jgi:hypothetical protein